MAKYYGIVSTIGETAIANSFLQGQKVNITHLAIGDGGGAYYEPTASMTALKNEVHRINANVEVEGNVVTVSGILPSDVGGFTVRELAAYDDKGRFIGVANIPDAPKVVTSDGANTEMDLGLSFAVSHSSVINLSIDPTIMLATKKDIVKAVNSHNTDPQSHAEIVNDLNSQLSNKANKGAAQKYPMPYVANLSPYKDSYYCKNEFGEVYVHIAAVTNDNSKLQQGQVIATLPEGFRPMASIEVGALFAQNSSALQRDSCALTISSNGSILVHPPNTNSGFCLSSFVLISL